MDPWRSVGTRPYQADLLQAVVNFGARGDMITQGNKKKANDKKCLHELLGALPLVVYNYVRGCKTVKEMWDTLKEKYQVNERKKKILVTKCLSELADFKQKENENIEAYYDMVNDLIFNCNRYRVIHTTLEFKL